MTDHTNKPFLNKSTKKGFSVVEVAIVLVIAGLLLAMVGSGMVTYLDIAKKKETITGQTIITKALDLYKKQKGRLPCPAVPTKNIEADSDYGDEVSGGCAASACPTGLICDEDVIIGSVPVAALGLGNPTSLDGWDNKLTYVVEKHQTVLNCKSNGHTVNSILINDPNDNLVTEPYCHETTGAAPILYATLNPPRSKSGSPAFLLISHGEESGGSWSKYGERSTCPATGNDKENCDDDSIFFDAKSSLDSTEYFDDILSWYHDESYDLCPAGVIGCVAWLDASDRCSMGLDASDNVTYLQDKIARSECDQEPDTDAPVASARPAYNESGYNAMPTITFDGNDYINLANIGLDSNDFEFYIVARPTEDHDIDTQSNSVADPDSGQKFLLYPSGSPMDDIGISLGENGVSIYEDSGTRLPIAVYTPGSPFGEIPQLIRVVYATGTPTIFINGVSVHTGEDTAATDIYLQLGKIGDDTEGFEGDFFEFLAYEGNLNSYDARRVEAYLMNKWRLN